MIFFYDPYYPNSQQINSSLTIMRGYRRQDTEGMLHYDSI